MYGVCTTLIGLKVDLLQGVLKAQQHTYEMHDAFQQPNKQNMAFAIDYPLQTS